MSAIRFPEIALGRWYSSTMYVKEGPSMVVYSHAEYVPLSVLTEKLHSMTCIMRSVLYTVHQISHKMIPVEKYYTFYLNFWTKTEEGRRE